ncbi:hypothetical protein BJ123_112165 [Rhodopseudomonas thermotolerans]|uniref:Uncharacterized protein n=2 Tax=Rhodopseudomonas TaxID=1073 RepID=A0A336JPU0_9BRAD|nr:MULTISPECIES: hypothetical protein [Rhodopseudomonas]RED32687.1 hypothetical protein BJ125_112166 [Rhodopseudomonas pentothenatexigens]REF93696.1 hypothetical protein BJ123_112165 [Rhodopseudomonas thermotolerans]SSW91582.1 hypothetical protein SAMN05892882_112166 [Rhodopseudomonas pentothenatexigens]
MIEDLTAIADRMDALLPLFRDAGSISGLILPTEHSATFKVLAIEAKSIIDGELNHANEFSLNLVQAVNAGAGGFVSGPSYASVQEASGIIRAAVRAIQRKLAKPSPSPPGAKPYVDHARIVALQNIGAGNWDFSRLVELCREINVAAANRCYMSTAMLLRTILNHVPPVLGFATFTEIASNYGGPKTNKSFKGNMQRLETSLRNIADMQLHSAIRTREDIPSAVQVDFAADLDVLLGEVIRVAKPASP